MKLISPKAFDGAAPRRPNRFAPTRCALAASLLVWQLGSAGAQTTPATNATTTVGTGAAARPADAARAPEDKVAEQLDRVVITGSTSLKRTVRESSVAVTVADREQLDRGLRDRTAVQQNLLADVDAGNALDRCASARAHEFAADRSSG